MAVALPGWEWLMGMLAYDTGLRFDEFSLMFDWEGDSVPDPDDPATAGCLLALLGPYACSLHDAGGWMAGVGSPAGAKFRVTHSGSSLGRACIAAAEALGRWPGGAP